MLVVIMGKWMLTGVHSWMYHPRPEEGGEEEAGQAQGAQDARLGQALTIAPCTELVLSYSENCGIPYSAWRDSSRTKPREPDPYAWEKE